MSAEVCQLDRGLWLVARDQETHHIVGVRQVGMGAGNLPSRVGWNLQSQRENRHGVLCVPVGFQLTCYLTGNAQNGGTEKAGRGW